MKTKIVSIFILSLILLFLIPFSSFVVFADELPTSFFEDFDDYSFGFLSEYGLPIWSTSTGYVFDYHPKSGSLSGAITGASGGSGTSTIKTGLLSDYLAYEEGQSLAVSWWFRPSRLDNLDGHRLLQIQYLDDNSSPLLFVREDSGSYYLSVSSDSDLLFDLGSLAIASYQYLSVKFISGGDVEITLGENSVIVPSVQGGSTPKYLTFSTNEHATNTCYLDDILIEVLEEEEEEENYTPISYISSIKKVSQDMIASDDPDWEDFWGDYTADNYSVDFLFSFMNSIGSDLKYLYFDVRELEEDPVVSLTDFQELDRVFHSYRYFPDGVPSFSSRYVFFDLLDDNIEDFLSAGSYVIYAFLSDDLLDSFDVDPENEFPSKPENSFSTIFSFTIWGIPEWREIEGWNEDLKVEYDERMEEFEDILFWGMPDWARDLWLGVADFWDRLKVRFPYNIPYALYLAFDTAKVYFSEYSMDDPDWDILIPADSLPYFKCENPEECEDDEGLLLFSSSYITENPVLGESSVVEGLDWLEFFRAFLTFFLWVGFAFYVFNRTMRQLVISITDH